MEKQMNNSNINAELDDTVLEEIAGGLNLGAVPVSDELSVAKHAEKNKQGCKNRLNSIKTTKVDAKEIEKTKVAKALREVADKSKWGD